MGLITINPNLHRARHIAALAVIIAVFTCPGCAEQGDAPASAKAIQAASSSTSTLKPELARYFRMIQEGRLDHARLHLQRHNLENSNDGQALFLFALTFHMQHRYDQARTHFEAALPLAPDFPPLRYFHGWCLYNLGELDLARQSFEAHLQMQADVADSHFALGLIAMDQNQLEQAMEHFNSTIRLLSDDPELTASRSRAHGKLGEAHTRLGGQANLLQAQQHLTTAAELYPDDHESLYQLYRVLLALDEPAAADDARLRYEAARRRAGLPDELPVPSER